MPDAVAAARCWQLGGQIHDCRKPARFKARGKTPEPYSISHMHWQSRSPSPQPGIDPGAQQIWEKQPSSCRTHPAVGRLLKASSSTDRVIRRDHSKRKRRPEKPQRSTAQCHGDDGEGSARHTVHRSNSPLHVAPGERRARERAQFLGRPEPHAKPAQRSTRGNVDEVMLVGRQHRDSNQREPGMQPWAEPRRNMPRVEVPKDNKQGDVERGKLVEGTVESTQRLEKHTRWPCDPGRGDAQAQRHGDEAGHRNDLGGQKPLTMAVELSSGGAKEKGKDIQQIDRPVGHDGPSEERDMRFPGEHDRADPSPP